MLSLGKIDLAGQSPLFRGGISCCWAGCCSDTGHNGFRVHQCSGPRVRWTGRTVPVLAHDHSHGATRGLGIPSTVPHIPQVNVGTCRGKCGPDEWPQDGTPDPDLYWTTECHVAGTKTLQIADVRIEVVTRCDCRPVRPRCQRMPHHVQHWGPDGTVQVYASSLTSAHSHCYIHDQHV